MAAPRVRLPPALASASDLSLETSGVSLLPEAPAPSATLPEAASPVAAAPVLAAPESTTVTESPVFRLHLGPRWSVGSQGSRFSDESASVACPEESFREERTQSSPERTEPSQLHPFRALTRSQTMPEISLSSLGLSSEDVPKRSSIGVGKCEYHFFMSHKKRHTRGFSAPSHIAQSLVDSLGHLGYVGWLEWAQSDRTHSASSSRRSPKPVQIAPAQHRSPPRNQRGEPHRRDWQMLHNAGAAQ